MERGLWGFTQEGKETPPEESASATVKMHFDCDLTKLIR